MFLVNSHPLYQHINENLDINTVSGNLLKSEKGTQSNVTHWPILPHKSPCSLQNLLTIFDQNAQVHYAL